MPADPPRPRPQYPERWGLSPARVCIIKPSALGDVVNAFPTLSALHDLWPNAAFTWVINRNLTGLIEGHPQIERAGHGVEQPA